VPSKPIRRARFSSRSPGLAGRKTHSGKRNHKPGDVTPLTIFTIGHSTRPIDEFIRLLKAHGVQCVVDVRTIPRSRHNPQFNRDQLSPALHRRKIHYRYMPGLGGLRRARPDSANAGWRNASFRGYADYMQTPEFDDSLEGCIDLANQERVVLMCAEAVPWRCHRALIADALLARGVKAREIMSRIRTKPHSLTPFARVTGTSVTYPAARTTQSAASLRRRRRSESAVQDPDHIHRVDAGRGK
jgi:Domain of unknown function DUF488